MPSFHCFSHWVLSRSWPSGPSTPWTSHPPSPSPAPVSRLSRLRANVSVSVPPVAFTERITHAEGRVRTAVLVNIAEPAGVATIVGLPDCTADAQPGIALWLDCAYAGGAGPLTVAVTLKDGSRLTHTVPVTS